MLERHAPRDRRFIALTEARALVGIEAEIEQQLEHIGTIVRHCDPEQAAGVFNGIRQSAGRVPRAKPVGIPQCRRASGGHRSTAFQQQRSDVGESLRIELIPACAAASRGVRS